MSEKFNDGRAFSYENTGESVMIMDNTIKHSEGIRSQGILTTLGLTSFNQSLNVISSAADPLPINGIDNSLSTISISYSKKEDMRYWVDTMVESAEVSNASPDGLCASTVVAGKTFDTSSITWHMKPIILKKMRQSSSNMSRKEIRMHDTYFKVGDGKKIKLVMPLDYYLSGIVYESDKMCRIVNGAALVDDNKPVPMGAGNNILEPLTATVEDYKPPSWGDTGSGSGVKEMIVVVQKYSYAQIYLAFDDTKITEVLGLPQGMSYNNQYILGSPLTSGVYNVRIKLDNLRTLGMTMQVPELPRTL